MIWGSVASAALVLRVAMGILVVPREHLVLKLSHLGVLGPSSQPQRTLGRRQLGFEQQRFGHGLSLHPLYQLRSTSTSTQVLNYLD